MSETEEFLQKTQEIVDRNNQQRKVKELRGELYNIFSVMNMERDEVWTHSPVLANLLNPKGLHGKQDLFLKLFLEKIPLRNLEDNSKLNTLSARVTREKKFRGMGSKGDTNGDIDILIEFFASNNQSKVSYAIIIENKIYAGDQPKQLQRYKEYADGSYGENYTLFYLTLYGNEPSEDSTGKLSPEKEPYWKCISYKEGIKSWLESCLDKSTDSVLVNGILQQYINLINKLTNQNLEDTMSEELVNLMLRYNRTICEIENHLWDWKKTNMKRIAEEVASATNCECVSPNDQYWIWNNNYWIGFKPKEHPDCTIWFGKDESVLYMLEKTGVTKEQTKLKCMKEDSCRNYYFGWNKIADDYSQWNESVLKPAFKDYLKECIKEILEDPNFPK